MRGGANGARIALAPQNTWAVNNPDQLSDVIDALRAVQSGFNQGAERQVSLADVIVLGGAVGIESAAEAAGVAIEVPFEPGRGDAAQAMTDVASFSLLEPAADAFRNYYNPSATFRSPVEGLVDKADLLDLSIPELTVLLGGMRVLDTNWDGSKHGVFTDRPGVLSNDYFVNLLDMATVWRQADGEGIYEGIDRATGDVKYTATPVDLVSGSNSELRAVAEVYAYADAAEKFVDDFVQAWTKVMRSDLF